MQYQIFVQNQADNSFIAAVIGMPDCIAEGQTREDAIANAKAAFQARLAEGEIVTVKIEEPNQTVSGNPWLESFGVFKDDPTFDDFLEKMAEYRHELDGGETAK